MFVQLKESARLVSRLAADDFQAGDRTMFLHRLMRVLLTLILLVLAVGFASAARAQETTATAYTIELVIFKTKSPIGGPEAWNTETAAAQQTSVPADAAEAEEGQAAVAVAPVGGLPVQAISSTQFRLSGIDGALQRNANYEVLQHIGWTQVPSPRGSGLAVNLADLATNNPPVRGTMRFERGKYLYLQLDLTYTPADPPASLVAASNKGTPVAFKLNQKRRVRPFERHYFDHPAFGVIAIISPVK